MTQAPTATPPRSTLAAVHTAKGEIQVVDRDLPAPGPQQVVIEVSFCGICGSDLHLILEGWGTPGRVEGHEFSGRIIALGNGVTDWQIGDQVVGGPSPRCGACRRCRDGKPSQCERRDGGIMDNPDGAFARYKLVNVAALLRLPDGLSLRAAALAEPLAVALHAITRSRIHRTDSALVLGAGPIGALIIAVLAADGHEVVRVVEPNPSRQALARSLGATSVEHPDALAVFPMWEPERIAEGAVDVVFECSGRRSAMEAGFHQLRRGGHLVLVGAGIEPPSFDPNRHILNELTVSGSFIYDEGGFDDALAWLASDRLPVELLIDPVDVPLDGVIDAMIALADGRIAGKAMVAPALPLRTESTA